MNNIRKAHAATRCNAMSKRTGERCKGPAVRGWAVCRFHGAAGGHDPGKANPAYKHGGRSQETVEMRKAIAEMVREAKEMDGVVE
jgi:hypothetical protein